MVLTLDRALLLSTCPKKLITLRCYSTGRLMFKADRELLQCIFQTFLFSQLGARGYSECAMKIALVTWSAVSAGVQGSLASSFKSLYCTVLNNKIQWSTSNFLLMCLPSNYYCFGTVYCSEKLEFTTAALRCSNDNSQIICIEICVRGLNFSITNCERID